jgi:hypothetical protein
LLANAAVLGLCVSVTLARPITVNSNIEQSPTGLRAQAVVVDPIGLQDGGGSTTARFIKEVHATILIRDDNLQNGLQVTKKMLTSSEAWGNNLPNGHEGPPITDPKGPWFGLFWPYRDQYDYFPGPNDPLGDDVGTFFEDQPGVYGFVDVDGIARGGPTDPSGGGSSPNLLLRGIPGNGLTDDATYFAFDINPLFGPFDRFVRVRIFGASAIVVQQDNQSGEYSEIKVQIPDYQIDVQLPEPATATAGIALVSLLGMRMRRTRA